MPPRQALCLASIVGLLGLCPVVAFAQQVDPANRSAFLSSASSTTTTTVVGGVIITVTVSTSRTDLERYLRLNAIAVAHDITRGAGATVEDLADAFGVDDVARFGRLLRDQRAVLLALADHRRLDAQRAAAFAALILAEVAR